jgi:hypothetical protein
LRPTPHNSLRDPEGSLRSDRCGEHVDDAR